MGMHIGLICLNTTVEQFRAAFARTWPEYEIIARAENLNGMDAIQDWADHQKNAAPKAPWSKDNPHREVFVFWQNGPWAVLCDRTYVLASDDENLQSLSVQFGRVLSFLVETAGGCAYFTCFENGKVRRRIRNDSNGARAEGEPLSEEAGIDVSDYYMAETEALWEGFGLTPFLADESWIRSHAICVLDHTDYNKPLQKTPDPPAANEQAKTQGHRGRLLAPRPWWKFW